MFYEGIVAMKAVSGYLLSIVCASVICAIVSSFVKERKQINTMVKLLSGIFLSITVISPLKGIALPNIADELDVVERNAQDISTDAQSQATDEIKSIIKKRLEAYILEKADRLEVTLQTDITLDDSLLPERIILTGNVTPYEKQQIQKIIAEDIGIAKEDQIWR